MSTQPRPTARRVQATVFRVVNVPMRLVLARSFTTPLSRRLMLIHHTGRKTGKHYRQPVSYVRHGDTLLTPGGGNWTNNLTAGQPVRIQLHGTTITARPELVTDPAQIQQLLATMSAANPALRRFIPIPKTPDGRLDPTSLARAIDHGFCIVRWHPDPTELAAPTPRSHS